MMKKVLSVLFALSLSMVLFSCGDSSTDEGKENKDTNEPIVSEKSLEGLEDEALIEAVYQNIKYSEPNYYLKLKTQFGEMEPVVTIQYVSGESNRMETEGSNTISVYRDDEKMMYTWDKETKKGTKIQMGSDDIDDESMLDFESFQEDDEKPVKARLENLNGEDVIYTESEEEGYLMKAWLKLNGRAVVKAESYENDKVVSTMETIEYKEGDYSDMMEIPSDIDFSDSPMNVMYDSDAIQNMQDMENMDWDEIQ